MADVEQLITNNLDIWSSAIKAKAGVGRGSSKKKELYGIKKLRELILELAVRGLLVPQDPNDEPASELLKKIATEKEQLIKDKKIKKPKALLPISDEEKPFKLPMGWEWVTLSHLGRFAGGKTPSKAKPEFWNGDIPWVTPKDMKVDEIFDSVDHVTRLTIENGLALIEEESLLFVVRSGILRRKFPVAITKTTCTVNQDLKVLTLFNKNISAYLLIMMNGFEQYILKKLTKTGTTVESLRFDDFSKHYFLFPPFEEQHRIVAKVDELMALCDQLEQQTETSLTAHQTLVETVLAALTRPTASSGGTEESTALQTAGSSTKAATLSPEAILFQHFDTLFTTQRSIDQLKQTILQLAVMGKLVPQNPNDEPASELLKKIAAEKAQLIKDKKIKKQKPLPPISDEEKLFELPKGWEWCRLQQLVTLLGDGLHGTPNYDESGSYFFVNGNNLKEGSIHIKPETKRVNEIEYQKHKKKLNSRTVFVSINGTLGNVAFYDNEPIMLGKSACYFNLGCDLSKLFFKRLIESPFFLNYAFKAATGSTIKNLGLKAMNNFPIALPPLDEQHRIVTKVNELMLLCDQLKAHLNKTQTTQLHLADALAEQAVG